MANKLFDQVSGIISVILKGKNQERIINMALTRGIYIWDIKKIDDSMHLKVRSSGYEALKNLTDENGYILEVKEKQGLPFFKNTIKRRLGFIGGALIFIMALYILSSFIWFVDVSGNKTVDKSRIMITAAKYGVYKGAVRWNFSRNEVEEAMLRDISELSYVKVGIKGVKANIEVVEKIFPKNEITGPCHMVASKDGVIEEILVLDGQAEVKKGDVVARGDILISGIVFLQISPYIADTQEEEKEPYTVRARGKVKAHVWYEGYGECRLKSEKMVLSDREISKIYIETPGKDIIIKGRRETGFPLSKQKINRKVIKTPLGEFGIYRVILQEQIKETTKYSENEAVKIAREKAMKTIFTKMGKEQKIRDSKVEILSSPSDSILRVKVSVEVIEDIARADPINVGDNSN